MKSVLISIRPKWVEKTVLRLIRWNVGIALPLAVK